MGPECCISRSSYQHKSHLCKCLSLSARNLQRNDRKLRCLSLCTRRSFPLCRLCPHIFPAQSQTSILGYKFCSCTHCERGSGQGRMSHRLSVLTRSKHCICRLGRSHRCTFCSLCRSKGPNYRSRRCLCPDLCTSSNPRHCS